MTKYFTMIYILEMIKNKVRLLVSLTPEQVKGLKQLARYAQEPFAYHVRQAVDGYLRRELPKMKEQR
jgi:hypothetical protein